MTLVKDAFGEYSTELFTKETEKVINNHDTNKVIPCFFLRGREHGLVATDKLPYGPL